MRAPAGSTEMSCAFCGKGASQVAQLVTGPTASICDSCVGVCLRILAGGRRGRVDWKAVPDEHLLGGLKPTAASVDAARKSLQSRVTALRTRGVSWAAIGQALGISRQAAWERFSKRA